MRRFRIAGLALAVVVVAVLTLAPPAAAMKYAAIRYWPSQTNVALSGGTAFRAYDTALVSISYRQDVATDWAMSFNFDTGGQSNFAGTWTGASGGSNTFWNINLHRTFMTSNAMASVFLGYGRASSRSTFGTDQTQTASGPRVGADVGWRNGPWSVMAWAAVGIGTWGSTTQLGSTTAEGSGSLSEYGAVLGYQVGSWNLEAGYRTVNFGVPAGVSFLAANFSTRGAIVGISKMWP